MGRTQFQSTRPKRGATPGPCRFWWSGEYFNPRAPYGARRPRQRREDAPAFISIHAPHTGRDPTLIIAFVNGIVFQSTRPIRGATWSPVDMPSGVNISIHAPHTGRDEPPKGRHDGQWISIHAPHTGRDAANWADCDAPTISIHAPHTGRDPLWQTSPHWSKIFQSTRPIRGATHVSRSSRVG